MHSNESEPSNVPLGPGTPCGPAWRPAETCKMDAMRDALNVPTAATIWMEFHGSVMVISSPLNHIARSGEGDLPRPAIPPLSFVSFFCFVTPREVPKLACFDP